MSIEYYSVPVENGYRRVLELVAELESRGYKVLAIPEELRPEVTPIGENADGKTYYGRAWRIPIENGIKPPMRWKDRIETIDM